MYKAKHIVYIYELNYWYFQASTTHAWSITITISITIYIYISKCFSRGKRQKVNKFASNLTNPKFKTTFDLNERNRVDKNKRDNLKKEKWCSNKIECCVV